MDGAATTLLTIQYNLAAGTLAPFAFKRPELQPILKKIMDLFFSAQFLLSEVGHGLDSPNLETTATLLPTGEFDLHTRSYLQMDASYRTEGQHAQGRGSNCEAHRRW